MVRAGKISRRKVCRDRRNPETWRMGNGCAEIAATLNREAWRPPKRRDTFNAPMVRRLLTPAGVIEPGRRRPRTIPDRQPDEWTIGELAAELGAPQSTLYSWAQTGRLLSRVPLQYQDVTLQQIAVIHGAHRPDGHSVGRDNVVAFTDLAERHGKPLAIAHGRHMILSFLTICANLAP